MEYVIVFMIGERRIRLFSIERLGDKAREVIIERNITGQVGKRVKSEWKDNK